MKKKRIKKTRKRRRRERIIAIREFYDGSREAGGILLNGQLI